ncbi:MAG: CBS domain-containing protein [Planctomycetota bacterium]|nr:CBS domain-containing protein [Planctomycetota bacterium]
MNEQTKTSPAKPETTYFLSEIIGRKVFFKDKKIGRLADIVIVDAEKLAEATHIVVERSFGYPSLLIPWAKVTFVNNCFTVDIESIEAYESKPAENMVMLQDHVLDKKVLDLEGNEVEVVYDIKLAMRNNKLYVTDVDSSRYGLLRRIGLKGLANFIYSLAKKIRNDTIPWMYIEHLPQDITRFAGDVKLKVLKEKLSEIPPVDLADMLEEMDHEQRVAIFKQLDSDHASDTLEEIEPRVQRELISSLKEEKVAELINQMTPAQATDILSILPVSEANDIIKLLDVKNSRQIQLIMQERDQKNIDFATTKFIKFPPQTSVREVIDTLRTVAVSKDVIMYVYIVDEKNTLLGVVDLRELLQANADAKLTDIMITRVVTLNATSTLTDASELFKRYGFRAVPIVDDSSKILGVVTYRDVMVLKNLFFVD